MAIKTIFTEPNKILRQVSNPVEHVGKEDYPALFAISEHLAKEYGEKIDKLICYNSYNLSFPLSTIY